LNKNIIMKDLFIDFDSSVKMKDFGFNEPCFYYYGIDDILEYGYNQNSSENFSRRNFTTAPLKAQVFKWFREKGYDVNIFHETNYYCNIFHNGFYSTIGLFETYDECEDVCIRELIKIYSKQIIL
jgi:hypothetical protein